MKGRFIPAPDHPLIHRKRSVRSLAAVAREHDEAKAERAAARAFNTKKAAKDRDRLYKLFASERTGVFFKNDKAKPVLSREDILAKRRSWQNE